MNGIRIAISIFLLVLIGLSIAGWNWTTTHQNDWTTGARTVLVLGAVSGVVALVELWRGREQPE